MVPRLPRSVKPTETSPVNHDFGVEGMWGARRLVYAPGLARGPGPRALGLFFVGFAFNELVP